MAETSVVIRTYNEEKHLPPLLEAIREQTYGEAEIIVVDSGSLDATVEVAERGADRVISIDSKDFTFGYSLNVGVRAARGRYVVLASAHTLPTSRSWLAALVEPFADPETAMVYGRQRGDARSKFSERMDFFRTFGPDPQVLEPPNFFANNANSAIRRSLWESYPFDEHLPGLEDIDWAKHWMEQGLKVVYAPDAALYHIHEESWRQVRRRYFREAVAARAIGIRGRGDLLPEATRELRRTLADLWALARHRSHHGERFDPERVREILLFRYNKLRGTLSGLSTGAHLESSEEREEFFFDRRGRAVVIEGPGKFEIEERSVPHVKPGDVLIRVAYTGVCATDLEILDGELGYYKKGLARYPIVPGHEVSGVVVESGVNASRLKPGTPVVVECIQSCGRCEMCKGENFIGCPERAELGVMHRDGGYADYMVVPGTFVHPLPPGTDLRAAALCEPLAVVLKGLRRLSATWSRSGPRRCAVVGLGPLGTLCSQVLRLRGHQVTGFDRDPTRRGIFAAQGFEAAVDLARLSEFDSVIEVTGDPGALDAVLHQSAAGATILLLGLPYARKGFSFEELVAYDKTVVGSVGSTAQDFEEAVELIGRLEVEPLLGTVVSLDTVEEAWELVRGRRHLKVMLEVHGDSAAFATSATASGAAEPGLPPATAARAG